MAIKKPKQRRTKLKKSAARKGRPVKKAAKKKLVKKKAIPKKNSLKKKAASKKVRVTPKTKASGKKTTSPKAAGSKKPVRGNSPSLYTEAFGLDGLRSKSAVQSGDLQALSNVESADSESVDELVEEGNAFEADVVVGVERAGNAEGKEVRTHEVPEDDVPGEYLDED
jgi:hypothetical protein